MNLLTTSIVGRKEYLSLELSFYAKKILAVHFPNNFRSNLTPTHLVA